MSSIADARKATEAWLDLVGEGLTGTEHEGLLDGISAVSLVANESAKSPSASFLLVSLAAVAGADALGDLFERGGHVGQMEFEVMGRAAAGFRAAADVVDAVLMKVRS